MPSKKKDKSSKVKLDLSKLTQEEKDAFIAKIVMKADTARIEAKEGINSDIDDGYYNEF